MPMTIGASFGTSSAYQQLQAERARNASARQQAASDVSALSDAFGGASQSLAQGLADLAAQAALSRIQKEAKAKQAASTADPSPDTLDPTTDPAILEDAAINGVTDLLPGNADTTGDASSSDLDVVTSVNQIIDGTAALLDTAADQDSGSDGTTLFAALDGIINSFVPPEPPIVDVTA